ncbi:AAA domain-containing protein [Actinacidiphila glaucinigra]|uniref:AAA domain-containing protein n=1 Tax=Actinacidiphila glaucinigra TaxID=235986 RepID=UPI0033B06C60
MTMIPVVGTSLLKNRYELTNGPHAGGGGSQIWEAFSDGYSYLVKTWRYEADRPDRVQRALWDQELRTLYKVASSPRSDEALVVLKDAGLDREHHCFVMVLEAPGYERVSDALRRRARYPWLSNRGTAAREQLWAGLLRVATGLNLLHERHVLHRGVDVDSLFFAADLGPESLRLGGFEWSVKLGRPVGSPPPDGWPLPPERTTGGVTTWRQDDDWFAFGILCARLLLDLERFTTNPPRERHARVLDVIETSVHDLTEAERKLLLDLVADAPLERLTAPYDIINRIQEITRSLRNPLRTQQENVQYIVTLDLRRPEFIDYLMSNGLREHLGLGPMGTFVPGDPGHRKEACEFVRLDLQAPLLYAVPGRDYFILVGGRLCLKITAYRGKDGAPTWQVADCRTAQPLRFSGDDDSCRELSAGRVFVYARDEVFRDRTIVQNATSWEPVLPKIDRGAQISRELTRFHDFVRASNQIELLLLDSQIFPYEILSGPWSQDGEEHVVVQERSRPEGHEAFEAFNVDFIDFLQKESQGSDRSSVILSGPRDGNRLRLPPRDRQAAADDGNVWQVVAMDPQTRRVTLTRPGLSQERVKPDREGFLRSAGMPGQISLFQRRKKAIDALDQHSYLLRSLAAPSHVRMDTGASELPVQLDHGLVDGPKRASIEDILRVRPIYTLQGPPGTGKTTLVAWLLREILTEDPVVQVLVTAQAHGAVDVLRSKVGEAFQNVPDSERPLEIRLRGAHKAGTAPATDGAEGVAKQVLERSITQLGDMPFLSDVQAAWLEDAKAMVSEINMMQELEKLGRRSSDFIELVKRGANLTYCTTSASDLVALAAGQAFDWSIVEEAGKAHGFDLALPLQAGHRWLLIGDHKQLDPYRYEDYRQGIEKLDTVVRTLKGLKMRAAGLLDQDWIDSWDQRSPAEREDFREFAKGWLKTFNRLYEYCAVAAGSDPLVTDTEAKGASAGQLIGQHRMHPDIGRLISEAYYQGRLVNRTLDENEMPVARVRHGFSTPDGIQDRAVVWLDVPWCRDDPRTREVGPSSGQSPYTNPMEAQALARFLRQLGPGGGYQGKLAVLAPYARQVRLLSEQLRGTPLPKGLEAQLGLNVGRADTNRFPTHTVDSFQGNQADVVAISLVRNNMEQPGQGLGFLDDPGRMNVLLSRAERLLVLVGSWDFFTHQLQSVQLADISQPLWSFKQIVTLLDEWFGNGKAVRITADLGETL